ncbi:MAG: hypothetical protein ACPL1D_01205 [Microgenomates group bacterium]
MTISNKYFEKESKDGNWNEGILIDYFAGQKIESNKNNQEEKIDFPIHGFETHAISPMGTEMISKGESLYYRSSTTAKIWQKTSLIDYFKDQFVINALPDAPDEQLPTAKLKTHAFTPDEWEVITYKNRLWKRKINDKNWQTLTLSEYFADSVLEKGTLPTSYWDIHTFSPSGEEIIIVSDKLYLRKINDKNWRCLNLKEYFGQDFPLEKEIEEKRKIEEENDLKKYEVIKEKVMNELRKFFRPELINRFDEVIIFEPLKFHHMMEIVKLQLKGVAKLLEDQEIGFSYTLPAVKEVVKAGFDPIYGARPLRRAIQKLVENSISSLIIEGKVKPGDQIEVDFDGENFIFNVEKTEVVEDKISKNPKGKFTCVKCGFQFETEIVKNATIICRKCLSKEVQLITNLLNDNEKTQKIASLPIETSQEKRDDINNNLKNRPYDRQLYAN